MNMLSRVLKKDGYASILNLFIYTLGISSFMCIFLVVRLEVSFDKFHSNYNRLYRLTTQLSYGDIESNLALTSGYWVRLFNNNFPEIRKSTMFQEVPGGELTFVVDKSNIAKVGNGIVADSNFLKVLNFELREPNMLETFFDPNSIVITENFSKKLFPDSESALNKTIFLNNSQLKIVGILNDLPRNSSLQFDFVITGRTMEYWDLFSGRKGGFPVHVYFETTDGVDLENLQEKINKRGKKIFGTTMSFPIQSVGDIHFDNEKQFDFSSKGNLKMIQILEIISFLILIMTCVNFAILHSSTLLRTAKNDAIRRVMGASGFQIVRRIILESITIGTVAGTLSILITELLIRTTLPFWFGYELTLLDSWYNVLVVLFISIAVSFISGIFPAFVSSKRNFLLSLKGIYLGTQPRGIDLNRILISLQFVITFVILIGSIIVFNQLNFLTNKELGYDHHPLINLSMPSDAKVSDWRFLINEIPKISNVQDVSTSQYSIIGSDYNGRKISYVDSIETKNFSVKWNAVGWDIVETMNLSLIHGRGFDRSFPTDSNAILINRVLAESIGLEECIGKLVTASWNPSAKCRIIGVIDDYHFQPFNNRIVPVALSIPNAVGLMGNILVKIKSDNYQYAISQIEEIWNKTNIVSDFEYVPVSNWFHQMIKDETQLEKLSAFFSIMSLSISILGLVGIIRLYLLRQRKPLNIKKVFGASASRLLKGQLGKFGKFVLVSYIVSLPFAYWLTNSWLADFEYRIKVSFFEYLYGFCVVIMSVFLVITVQAWKYVNENPILSLRNE